MIEIVLLGTTFLGSLGKHSTGDLKEPSDSLSAAIGFFEGD